MKKKIYIYTPLLFGILGFIGCGNNLILNNTPQKQTISVQIDEPLNKVELHLTKIAKQTSQRYTDYISLMESLKKKHLLEKETIPRNLGKRYTFMYDGYALILLKKMAIENGYSFNLGNLIAEDSPIIHRRYQNTMAIDIIKDVSSGYGYKVTIDTEKMEIGVSYR